MRKGENENISGLQFPTENGGALQKVYLEEIARHSVSSDMLSESQRTPGQRSLQAKGDARPEGRCFREGTETERRKSHLKRPKQQP